MKKSGILIARILCAVTGLGFLLTGIFNSEYRAVLEKAVRVCLECIGIG